MEGINAYNPRYSSMKKMQKTGKNAATIQQDNRTLILELISENGEVSRKQLANMTGLQLATITIIIKELLAQGLICESGRIDGGSGRSVQAFSLAENLCVIAIRVTAVYVKIAAYDSSSRNKYVKKVFFKTDDTLSECFEIMLAGISEIENRLGRQNILGIGIGLEHRVRIIDDDYAIWDEKRQEYCYIGKRLHDLTGYCVFANRAINFSTYRLNRTAYDSAGHHILINICFSYELESAIIIDNEIIYGKNGRCGQMKNIRASRDKDVLYKDILTVPAVLNRVSELLPEHPDSEVGAIDDLNIRDVIAGYDHGDTLCRKVFDEVCCHLGYCIAELMLWLDPDAVYVGDELPSSVDFSQNLRKYVTQYADEKFAQRVHCLMKERLTQNDPALIGAADYTFQRVIVEIGLGTVV